MSTNYLMWPRIKPALLLVVLTPLIAEYLSGSLSFAQLPLFPLMALMYGTGALVIREVARRTQRGWPTILMLGIAYGLIEEGLATQSLFNPHYLGLRLLDRGFIEFLGIGGPWTIYVILLHVVWSIAIPIGFVEAIFAKRRTSPWLGNAGLAVSGVAFVLGVALVAFGTWNQEHFAAYKAQLIGAALLAAMFLILAFRLFRPLQASPNANTHRSTIWRPAVFGLLALMTGSAFHLAMQFGPALLMPSVQAGVCLVLPLIVVAAVAFAIRSGEWTTTHTDALVFGGLAVYCWLGFLLTARLHGPSTIPGQIFPLAVILATAYFGIAGRNTQSAAA